MPKKLDDEHSLLRYVPWGKLRKSNDGETVIGVNAQAFQLRPDEEFLSATWIDYFNQDHGDLINQSVWAVRASKLNVTKKSGFTVGIVEEIRAACSKCSPRVRFLHEAEKDNAAHAALRHWPSDALILEDLAEKNWARWFLNQSVPDKEN
jgi:hypothetical protein